MKQDVLAALAGQFPAKIPSKETLNHPGIMQLVSGLDPWEDTPAAFEVSWRKLGIDVHSALPAGNVARPRVPGGTWEEGGVRYADYGVYPTSMPLPEDLGARKLDLERIFEYDPAADDFDLAEETREWRERRAAFEATFGDLAVMYHLYYTTLFMWPVMRFGWEDFMLAAASDPVRFDERLWGPWAAISRRHMEALAAMDEEVVFCHDDLAMATGPVFRLEFYDRYIFPRYEWIMEPVTRAGKKLIFVVDGNSDAFLRRLLEFPFAGIMPENPATSFDLLLETWGKAGRGFLGGISTALLTQGTPEQVAAHTREIMTRGREYPGFMVSSCGGLPGNIPLENLLAYFRTRSELGCPAEL
jgi:hypothetical protein